MPTTRQHAPARNTPAGDLTRETANYWRLDHPAATIARMIYPLDELTPDAIEKAWRQAYHPLNSRSQRL
ncbi:hypothetical protein HY634_04335 [Candidatus Uhrbacteria bacterium]|nr:hypothetical protein [Candidatus Uhrbacteria bacterium]